MTWTYNLFEALRRLGVKHPPQPALNRDQVIQALIVGDVSHLASRVDGANALIGGYQANVAGERTAFQLWSKGPGGCVIETINYTSGQGRCHYLVSATDPLAADALAVPSVPQNLGPTNLQTTGVIGTSTVNATAVGLPITFTGGIMGFRMVHPIFIPRSYIFTMQMEDVNLLMNIMCHVRDVPVIAGDA